MNMGFPKEEMTGHGFRGMASTLLHEKGWDSQIIEKQLTHSDSNSVRGAYNHAVFLSERKKMMQAWSDYLDELKSSI
ncbi:MAG: tyrosine-type recombinase/integrase [Desulfotignum sp.]